MNLEKHEYTLFIILLYEIIIGAFTHIELVAKQRALRRGLMDPPGCLFAAAPHFAER